MDCVVHGIAALGGLEGRQRNLEIGESLALIAAELLAAGLVGAAETAARFWLAGGRQVDKSEAERLVATLAWRGIASFPLAAEQA